MLYRNYVISYDTRNRTAHWVFEHLTRESVRRNDEVDRTKSDFQEDTSIHPYFRSKNTDYKVNLKNRVPDLIMDRCPCVKVIDFGCKVLLDGNFGIAQSFMENVCSKSEWPKSVRSKKFTLKIACTQNSERAK